MPTVLLDTDIGSDVDDALALAVLLGSPDVTLAGVTTVYGDTVLRARLASRLIRLARSETPNIPVYAGARQPLSGRRVWWAGHEGAAFQDLDSELVQGIQDEGRGVGAADFLIRTVEQHPGEVDVLAIGPLTNIAMAIRRSADFASSVRRLYIMGGHFSAPPAPPEHNFLCDAEAARIVFDSGAPITVTGLEITTQVQLDPADVRRIEAAGPFGRVLKREIDQWWQFHGHPWNNPHDPIAAMTLLAPGAFELLPCDVEISLEEGREGQSSIAPSRVPRTSVTSVVDGGSVKREIVERIVAAASRGEAHRSLQATGEER